MLAANRARIVDQAAALEAAFPDASFDVALGHDTLARLFEPRYYDGGAEGMARALERFFARHRVIAANRGDAGADAVAAWAAERAAPFAGRILVVALDERHARLSSSAARARLEAGLPCDDLPDGVAERIRARGLYRPGRARASPAGAPRAGVLGWRPWTGSTTHGWASPCGRPSASARSPSSPPPSGSPPCSCCASTCARASAAAGANSGGASAPA